MRWEEAQRAARSWHIKQLNWIVNLMRARREELREGDWLNIRQDLSEFIGWTTPTASLLRAIGRRPDKPPQLAGVKRELGAKLGTMDSKDLKQIQESVKRFLQSFAGGANLHVCAWGQETYIAFRVDESFQPFQWMVYHRDLATAVEIALGLHLVSAAISAEQIRNCPQCGELFLIKKIPRTDRNFYCSVKCTRLAATHRYREGIRKNEKRRKAERPVMR